MMTIGQGMRFHTPPAGAGGDRLVGILRFALFIPLIVLATAVISLLY